MAADSRVLPFPPVDHEKRIALLEHLVDAAAKALDEERARADAWERRARHLTETVTQLYEAFGVRLGTIEATLDRHAQMLQVHELTLTVAATATQETDR